MQQTTNYKLNLVERDDAFSPDPLNDNAQKLESALTEAERARAATNASLSSTKTDLNATNSQLNATNSKLSTVESNLAKAKTDLTNAINAAKSEAKSGDQAEANARANAINALANRVTTLEGHKIVTGTATTAGTVNLGFTPAFLYVAVPESSHWGILIQAQAPYASGLSIVNNGFTHAGQFASCHYFALI